MSLETISREHVVKGVSPRTLFDVVTDYPSYSRLFPEFTSVKVLKSEGDRRRVEFKAKIVTEVRYVIEITQDAEKLTTSWTFVEGEIVSDSVGGWQFFKDGPGGEDTRILYHAGISVKAPLPKFVLNKVANALMGTSIPNMFKAVEKEARTRG